MGSESKQKRDANNNASPCSTISVPIHLLSAGTAAAASAIAVQPLDVLKTRLQTNVALRQNLFANIRHIVRMEGARGLYRGLVPTLGSVVPSISIYFTLYNSIKGNLGCPSGDPLRDVATQSFAAGLASSATAAITNPLWLVKTRLQTQPIFKNQPRAALGTLQTVRAIVREEGVRGLYKGLGASFLASTQAMVQFPIYEELKTLMCNQNHTVQKKTCSYLAASAISASLACIITYPAEVVRARLQAQGHVRVYEGVLHAFRKIWVQEGASGLYRGLFTSLLKMTPAHAISFTTYEFILRFLTAAPEWNVQDLDACDYPKNENIQYSFRPYLPPQFEFYRFPRAERYAPKANPYSFAPSFSHLLAVSQTSSDPSPPSPSEKGKGGYVAFRKRRWSEYFW